MVNYAHRLRHYGARAVLLGAALAPLAGCSSTGQTTDIKPHREPQANGVTFNPSREIGTVAVAKEVLRLTTLAANLSGTASTGDTQSHSIRVSELIDQCEYVYPQASHQQQGELSSSLSALFLKDPLAASVARVRDKNICHATIPQQVSDLGRN
jgi:hypothetical protein